MRESSWSSSFMGNTKSCVLQQVFCFFASAKNHHTYTFFFHAENITDFSMAHLLDMCQPQDGALLGAEPLEDRGHVDGQAEILVDVFGSMAQFRPFPFPLLPPPAVAQDVGRGRVKIRLAMRLFPNGYIHHAQIGFLQDFIRGSGVAAETAKIAVQSAGGAQVESLELCLANADAFCSRLRHGKSLGAFDEHCQSACSDLSFFAILRDTPADTRNPAPSIVITMPTPHSTC